MHTQEISKFGPKFPVLSRRHFGQLDRPVLRRSNPPVQGVANYIDDFLYDSATFAAGAAMAKTTLFKVPEGGAKTIAQTNMQQAGVIDNGETFQIYGFSIWVANDTVPADANNIARNVSVKFTVGSVDQIVAPTGFFPAGIGVHLSGWAQLGTAPAGTATVGSTSFGVPNGMASVYKLSNPIILGPDDSIKCTLNPETGFSFAAAAAVNPLGVGTTIYVILWGYRVKGVR